MVLSFDEHFVHGCPFLGTEQGALGRIRFHHALDESVCCMMLLLMMMMMIPLDPQARKQATLARSHTHKTTTTATTACRLFVKSLVDALCKALVYLSVRRIGVKLPSADGMGFSQVRGPVTIFDLTQSFLL